MRKRGVAFLLALAAMAVVVTVVAIAAQNQTGHARLVISRIEQKRAEQVALAGLRRALADIQVVAETTTDPVTLDDDWAALGTNGSEEFILGSDSFRIQIIDNCAKLDLNSIPEEALNNFNWTQEQIDSFLDWRTAGQSNRAQGAKDDYYNGLAKPYNAHENQLQSIYELLDIKGFTPQNVFYPVDNTTSTVTTASSTDLPLIELVTVDAYSSATTPEGDGRVNVNNAGLQAQQFSQQAQIPLATATQILAQRQTLGGQFQRLSQVLATPGVANNQAVIRSVIDRMSVATGNRLTGQLNINTAPAEVLQLLPGLTPDLANQIVDSRPTGGYRLVSELLSVSSDSNFLNTCADYFNVNSQSFLVRCVGKAGGTEYGIEAVIQIDAGVPKVLRIERPPYPDLPAQWGWSDATTQTSLLEN